MQHLVFFDELCGPTDFTQLNAQFVRVVPALVRLFLSEIVETVASLAALHVLSESLDSEMAAHLAADAVSNNDYMRAWQATARGADRRGPSGADVGRRESARPLHAGAFCAQ